MESKSKSSKSADVEWLRPEPTSYFSQLVTNILKQGPVPRHIACILDGNRSYSRAQGMSIMDGYDLGNKNMSNFLDWTRAYGVEEVTFFTFSIENNKRQPGEIMGLMEKAMGFCNSVLERLGEFNAYGVNVRVIGDWSCVPPRLKPLMARVMLATRDNTRYRINLAFMYTGRNEITRGVQEVWRALSERPRRLNVADLSVPLLNRVISTSSAKHPVDLLIRTSGCTRLSDYMMWQSTEAVLHFVPEMWPEFNDWSMHKAIFFYQRQRKLMQNLKIPKALSGSELDKSNASPEALQFLKDLEGQYWTMLENAAATEQLGERDAINKV